jgi:antitoxin component of RelBE/YafQ-DinJ toxin-antitoxin module
MVKGRSSKVVGVRVPDSVYTRIKALADRQGLTVSEWCKVNLARSAGLLPDGEVRTHHKKR